MQLATLLLQSCAEERGADLSVRFHCSLTHEEIGEYIGLSRETVTRNPTDFKNLDLVEQHGSTQVGDVRRSPGHSTVTAQREPTAHEAIQGESE
jgi:CRP-like cAMP-binding protein